MPITLQKMAANTATLTIPWGEETINLVYYPGRVTEKTLAQIQSLGSITEDNALSAFENFNATMASLVQSWNIYEDEGSTVLLPLTADSFSMLPFGFRVQLVEAIIGDVRPEAGAPQTKTLSPAI